MSQELRKDTISGLFMNLLQHMKSMEVRLDYAKVVTSQKQKYAINQALVKVKAAVNTICDLLGDSEMVLQVKKELDNADLVYVMLLTEQLLDLPSDDLADVTDMIEEYINKKHADVKPE
jgi:multidrug efflux pump subunit AcrB